MSEIIIFNIDGKFSISIFVLWVIVEKGLVFIKVGKVGL